MGNHKSNSIKKLLNTSIKDHLISDVKIGSFLSGGTDSSLVTSLACKNLKYKMSTFTYDFKNSSFFSESIRAKNIAQKLNLNNQTLNVDSSFVLKNLRLGKVQQIHHLLKQSLCHHQPV